MILIPRIFEIVVVLLVCQVWTKGQLMETVVFNQSATEANASVDNSTYLPIKLPTSSPTATSFSNGLVLNSSMTTLNPENVTMLDIPPIASSAHTCAMLDPITKQPRPIRIVTSSDEKYFPVLMNWLVYFHKHCSNVAIIHLICMDAIVEKKAEQHGLTCGSVIHVSAQNHHEIWLTRVKLAQKLLASGHDVLMSDSDAVWLQNPFPYFEQFSSSDIIASRGSFPGEVSKALGAAICMGFIYVRASEHTVGLWGEVATFMGKQKHADDQRDLNMHLLGLHLRYPNPKPTYVGSSTPSTGHFQHKNHNFAVTLLPHNTFLRICDKNNATLVHSSIVAHCLSPKTTEGKHISSQALGLWLLREDWETVKTQSDMDAYLTSISTSSNVRRKVRSMLQTEANSTVTMIRHNSGDSGRHATPICVEYFSNRELFHSLAGRAGRYACWYVSHSAPDSAIREFEDIISVSM